MMETDRAIDRQGYNIYAESDNSEIDRARKTWELKKIDRSIWID